MCAYFSLINSEINPLADLHKLASQIINPSYIKIPRNYSFLLFFLRCCCSSYCREHCHGFNNTHWRWHPATLGPPSLSFVSFIGHELEFHYWKIVKIKREKKRERRNKIKDYESGFDLGKEMRERVSVLFWRNEREREQRKERSLSLSQISIRGYFCKHFHMNPSQILLLHVTPLLSHKRIYFSFYFSSATNLVLSMYSHK